MLHIHTVTYSEGKTEPLHDRSVRFKILSTSSTMAETDDEILQVVFAFYSFSFLVLEERAVDVSVEKKHTKNNLTRCLYIFIH